MTRKMVTGV
ncbi:Protein of unknown function [Bacillus cereus]|nr:Protein of unknown function [Bacillus wiedmannii]SCV18641.1 Protein of unknown function [Bacillus cereus]